MGVELRPYQVEAVNAISAAWTDHNDALLCMATGTGKTIVFSSIVAEQVSMGQNVLILAHRKELLSQAKDKLFSACGVAASIELGKLHWTGAGVCISSVQTMVRRLGKFSPDMFGVIIIDECHHSMSRTYQDIINHYPRAKLLGVTATPDRGDGQSLLPVFPNGVTYEYGLRRAIEEGYLCRIRVEQIPVEIDLRNVRVTHGDYNDKDLGEAIAPRLEDCAMEIVKRCGRENKVVVFTPTIQLAVSMAAAINSRAYILPDGTRSLTAEMICGESTDREEILDRFRRGETNVLCNAMLLTEGWDEPSVDTICVLRPTKSRALYAQMVGRGTRLHEGKQCLRLLDMMCLAKKHDLCKPADLFSDDERVTRKLDNMDGDLLDAVSDTEGEVAREAERDAQAEARRSAERALLDVDAHEEYDLLEKKRKKLMCADDYRKCTGSKPTAPTSFLDCVAPTPKQLAALERFGIDPDSVKSKHDASNLIGELMDRSRNGMATPAQMRTLNRYGYERVSEWTKSEASIVIGTLSAAGWKLRKVPPSYRPERYLPSRLDREWLSEADTAEIYDWNSFIG